MTVDTIQIKECFAPNAELKEEILDQLLHICQVNNLSPEQLHNKWESFCIRESRPSEEVVLNETYLKLFKDALLREYDQKRSSLSKPKFGKRTGVLEQGSFASFSDMVRKQSAMTTPSNGKFPVNIAGHRVSIGGSKYDSAGAKNSNSMADASMLPAPTPVREFTATSFKDVAQDSPGALLFKDRKNKGEVICSLNEGLMDTDDDVSFDNPRIEIVLYEGYLQKPYKYMYEKLSEKSAALDDHLMDLRQLIAEENDFINDIGNPYHTSQSMISTVGKISCENETKLSAESCMVEMPKVSGSSKILLNLQNVPSFSIFPGAVFGLQGVNNNGKEFRVSKLLQPSLPEKMSTSVQELFEYNHGERKMGSKSVSVVIASGPYTLDESLAYEPFKNLMDEVETKRPDLLILMGPFVDENAAIIEEGLTFETVFSHTMGTRLLSYLRSNIHAQIVMIPSADDLLTESMVFPQPPLSYSIFNPLFAMNKTKESKKLLERIIMMPNPCVFSVNEMVFAATSRDVVFDIATEEISRRPESDDRVEGLVKHMLRQRTFYPLVPVSSNNVGLVEYSKLFEHGLLNILPDVFILPSKLTAFTKVVETCLCINMGQLTKRKSGGSYCEMKVLPIKKEEFGEDPLNSSEEMYHALDGRTKVEIKRV